MRGSGFRRYYPSTTASFEEMEEQPDSSQKVKVLNHVTLSTASFEEMGEQPDSSQRSRFSTMWPCPEVTFWGGKVVKLQLLAAGRIDPGRKIHATKVSNNKSEIKAWETPNWVREVTFPNQTTEKLINSTASANCSISHHSIHHFFFFSF